MINRHSLEALRTKDGQSKAQLARRVGISPQYYGEIESGKRGQRIPPSLVKALAQALAVPQSALTCEHTPVDAA